MYGIEGLELLSFIKDMHPKTEVIIMTAYGTEEIKEDAYRRGAYYYYEKPIDLSHLVDKGPGAGDLFVIRSACKVIDVYGINQRFIRRRYD